MTLPFPVQLLEQQPAHAEGLFHALFDPRIYTFLDEQPPATVGEVREQIERKRNGPPPGTHEVWLNWSVILDDMIVGYTQATVQPNATASIAYVLSPSVWGKGVAFSACQQTLSILRKDCGIKRAIADTEAGNIRSADLLRRLEFVQIDRTSTELFFEKNWTDDYSDRGA